MFGKRIKCQNVVALMRETGEKQPVPTQQNREVVAG